MWREVLRWEDEEGHGTLELFEKRGVGGSARGKLARGEVEDRSNVCVGRVGTALDELDELEVEERKVELWVGVEYLLTFRSVTGSASL